MPKSAEAPAGSSARPAPRLASVRRLAPVGALVALLVVALSFPTVVEGLARPLPLALIALLIPLAYAAFVQVRSSASARQVERMRAMQHAQQDASRRELAGIVHDLKGPLATVASYLDLIAEGALGPVNEETRDAALRAAGASARARALVESALLQHVESVAARPAVPPVGTDAIDLHALIREVTEALHADLIARHAEVTVEPLPRVRGDQARLFRIFENLVQNAVKYARPGESPIVTITGSVQRDRAEIAVSDHGIGIPAEDRDRVFEAGARADNGADLAAGQGLGLVTVRRLVHDLGGEVWIDPAPAEGATFRLSLPLAS